MEKIWSSLYKEAKKRIKVENIPPFIEYGNNTCTILADNNKIYFGISIASNSSIGSNAEKNAITMMLNDGAKYIKKMVILNELEELIPPSEDSLDYLLELSENEEFEVLLDYEKEKVVTIKELLPNWWGTYRNKKN